MSIDSPYGKYIVPCGDGHGSPIILDIQEVVAQETRLQEVATVNSHNAAELLSCFADNWGKLNKSVTLLTHHKNVAQHALDVSYAEAILGADEALQKRQVKSSKETREAIATVSVAVRQNTERLNEIKTVLSYVQGKATEFQNAYHSVKRLISDGSSWQSNKAPNAPGSGSPHVSSPREIAIFPDSDNTSDELDMPPGFFDPHTRK